MSEYVSKKAVKGAIGRVCFGLVLDEETEKVLTDAIDETPATTIVFCQDCKYGKKRRKYNGLLPCCDMYCVVHREFIQRNDFCSYGESE